VLCRFRTLAAELCIPASEKAFIFARTARCSWIFDRDAKVSPSILVSMLFSFVAAEISNILYL